MASVGRLVAGLLVVAAAVGPSARFSSAESLDAAYNQGLARTTGGWVVSGTDVLARLDEHLQTVQRLDDAIPAEWRQRGFNHIGDIDVAGTTLYVPFEQPDYAAGHQAMARYDADTLTFRDAAMVDQHENSFVAVDPASGIAYSMDRFDGSALLRYDVRAGWRPLAPLRLDRKLTRVQGAAIARNAVWLATDDAHHGLYRVDIDSGVVERLGSAPPDRGEGEGVDATTISSGNLHTTVVNADRAAVTLDHFRTRGEPTGSPPVSTRTDTSWPPALTYFAIAIAIAAIGAVLTVFYRAPNDVATEALKVDSPRYAPMMRGAADVITWGWEQLSRHGTLGPRSRRARRFGHFGDGSAICFPVTALYGEEYISLGEKVIIGPYGTLSAGVMPGHVPDHNPVLTIGDRTLIGKGSGVVGHSSIHIGDDVWTGHHVYITDANHGYEDVSLPPGLQFSAPRPVVIADGAWLGHGTIVLPGASIGKHAVIGGGSVVTGDIPDFSVAVGNPARVIRKYVLGEGWVRVDPHVPDTAPGAESRGSA